MRSVLEKTYIVLENIQSDRNRLCRNTNVKGTAGEDSEGIEKNATRNGKKGILVI